MNDATKPDTDSEIAQKASLLPFRMPAQRSIFPQQHWNCTAETRPRSTWILCMTVLRTERRASSSPLPPSIQRPPVRERQRRENVHAVIKGFANLERHLDNPKIPRAERCRDQSFRSRHESVLGRRIHRSYLRRDHDTAWPPAGPFGGIDHRRRAGANCRAFVRLISRRVQRVSPLFKVYHAPC